MSSLKHVNKKVGTYTAYAPAIPDRDNKAVSASRAQPQDTFDGSSSVPPPHYEGLRNNPPWLAASSVVVPYEPLPMRIDTRKRAVNAVFASPQDVPALTNILGTYVQNKVANEIGRQYRGVFGIYGKSKPEVQMYNHVMHKLETLSANVVQDGRSRRQNWITAVGPFRREAFANLYNNNEIVRCFANEIPGGAMALPQLDEYALGTKRTNWLYPRARVQLPNMGASMELLGRVRTVVLLDDSGSMRQPGHMSWSWNDDNYGAGAYNAYSYDDGYTSNYSGNYVGRGLFADSYSGERRWDQAARLLAAVAPRVSLHSPFGVDLHFLNRGTFYQGLKTSDEVLQAFHAGGPGLGTPTGQRVNDILDGYMSTLRHYRNLMPLNLIVITDGESEDEETLHWSIEEHVTKIMHRGYQAHQLGIEFVQVGDCRWATRHLIALEEEVSRHHLNFQRDVVGVTPATRIGNMSPDTLLAITVSGIDARINGYMRRRGINV